MQDPARVRHAIKALLSFWGDKPLASVDDESCDKYAVFRGVSSSTIRKELPTLTEAQNYSRRKGVLERTVDVPLPPKAAPCDRFLTENEAARLLLETRNSGRKARTYLPLFTHIALYTGARTEAILSLTWDRVDLNMHRINFAVPGRAQTAKRRPVVPIPRKLLTFLRYAYERRVADDAHVLSEGGKPLKRVIRGFKSAATRAGLSDVTPHTSRHTCGTWMAQRSVPLHEISGYLGQEPDTTQRNYIHHHADFMQRAKKAADRD